MNKKDVASSADELKYWVAFSMVPGIGSARGNKLVNYFDTMENAWKASDTDLARAGIDEGTIAEIKKSREILDLDLEMEKIAYEGISLITIKDKNYPKLLSEIYNPPFLLYVRGELLPEDEFAFAVVGARRCSDYGRQVTKDLVSSLAQNKITVISGLAAGIDGIAHATALAVPEARTIAVLGCGIDQNSIYPAENRALATAIINGRGAIISEYPIATPPLKQNFPARNRIISGLSLGVLVIEATEVSGSLITGQFALEQGRDVFAVPGSIYNKNASGPNALIKKGAKLVEKIDDILEELHLKNVVENIEAQEIIPENEDEVKVLKALELEPKHIDELVRTLSTPISDLNALLVTMEMKGSIKNIGGGNYMKARR